MGCDIHLHIEVKIDGEWHHYGCPSISRRYSLFGKMAGVRGYEDTIPIALPRGIPSDATKLTKFDYKKWGPDAHSASFLDSREIDELERWATKEKGWKGKNDMTGWWMEDEFGYLFGNSFAGFSRYPEDRPKGLEDVRFVFWFDN